MKKLIGFKIVSIIYIIIFSLTGLLLSVETAFSLGSGLIGPYIITLGFILILLLLLIIHIVIFKKNKKGKLTKNVFIFPIISTFILIPIISIPYIIVCAVTMNRLNKEDKEIPVLESNEKIINDNIDEEHNEIEYTNVSKVNTIEDYENFISNLKFIDSIVSSKDWKRFRKTASPNDLFAIAVGSKYRSSGINALIKKMISIIGTILSIVIGIIVFFNAKSGQLGFVAIIIIILGYLFFNMLAIKQIGYAETLSQSMRKLQKEDRELIKKMWNKNPFVDLLNALLNVLLTFMVIPYQFIIIVLTTMIPKLENWGIAKGLNSSVISLPNGYNIEELDSLSNYYKETKFWEVVEKNLEEKAKEAEIRRAKEEAEKLKKVKAYSYKDSLGREVTVYSNDGKNYYSNPECESAYRIGEKTKDGKKVIINGEELSVKNK